MSKKESMIYIILIIAMLVSLGLYLSKTASKKEDACFTEPLKFNELHAYLISSLITSECSNCSDKGKYLVGQTVTNRARIYKKQITDIVFEKNQYYYKCNFYPANTEIAVNILTGLMPKEFKNNKVTHFYDTSATYQQWMLKMEVIYYTDNLIIGYINDNTRE